MTSAPPEKKTILIVEDDAVQREGLGLLLRRAGYKVQLAADGLQAMDQLRGGTLPDVMVLDMLLPGLDGWQVLDGLRRQAATATLPIILATGTVLSREWALDHGCVGFVRKPIDMNALLAEIQRCSGGEHGGPSSPAP